MTIPGLNWLNIGAGAVAAFALSWLLHTVDVGRIEAKYERQLNDQAAALQTACEKDKAITKGANDDLQKKVSAIAAKLAASKRLHNASCIVPATVPADATSSGREHAGSHGISTDWLFDYAADCETYRQQRITLETFIHDERAK